MNTGVYLVASTDAEGVLYRQSSGLSYDTVAVQFTSTVYLVHCATGKAPAWHASPCTMTEWTEWMKASSCLRNVQWLQASQTQRTFLAQFIATTCISLNWHGWSPDCLGDILQSSPTPIDVPSPPLTTWERLVVEHHPADPPPVIVEHVKTWVRSMARGTPPVIDLNTILSSLGMPLMQGATSVAATMLILPKDTPRTIYLPETSHVIPLWRPCIDALTYEETEQLNYLLHTPEYLPHRLYDELREVCQKKLGVPNKRWHHQHQSHQS